MEAIRKIIENATTPLTIELPDEYQNIPVEVIVKPLEQKGEPADLSAFFGKLKWKGDALAEQKKIRDEWD
jgi:hypothetical protein